MLQIEKYINSISYDSYFENETQIHKFIFRGDGIGDFEQYSDHCSKKAIKDYVDYLRRQLTIIEIYLKDNYNYLNND